VPHGHGATRQGTPPGGVISPLLANIVLNHLEWRVEALGEKVIRYAADCGVLGTTTRQVEKARAAVTACVEEALGWALNLDKPHLTTCGQGVDFLGDHVPARPLRLGGKAAERFTRKSKELTRRSHNLEADVVTKVNRGVRGTVRSFATACSTGLGQCNALARWIRMRLRCMTYKRIWKTDNRRVKSRHRSRMGCVRCREVYVGTKEGEETNSSSGAISSGSPGGRKTHAGQYGELTPLRQRGGAGHGLPLTHWLYLDGSFTGRMQYGSHDKHMGTLGSGKNSHPYP
jgi:hypothetical protein